MLGTNFARRLSVRLRPYAGHTTNLYYNEFTF